MEESRSGFIADNIFDYSRLNKPISGNIYNMDNEISCDEISSTILKGAESEVGNDEAFQKILDRMDQDRREQEKRLSNNMQLIEQRITEERRLSEERMEKRFNETMESIKSMDKKMDSLETKLDQKTDRMLDKIDNTNKWIIGTCIASILAVAAIAASVWVK